MTAGYYFWNGEIVVKRDGVRGLVSVDTEFYHDNTVRAWSEPPWMTGIEPIPESTVLELKLLGRIDTSKLSQAEECEF